MQYIYYKTDGNVEVIESEKPLSLAKMQELVGGLIEFAPTPHEGLEYCVNEEGLVHDLPENPYCRYEAEDDRPQLRGNILLGRLVEGGEDGREFVGFDVVKA